VFAADFDNDGGGALVALYVGFLRLPSRLVPPPLPLHF